MNNIMSSWEGAHIEEAVSQWGYPDEEKEILGKKLLIWNSDASTNLRKLSCTRTLEVDKNNTIKSSQWSGNNCPYAEWFGNSNWRRKQDASD